ncbi:unnamed protein product [Caenorhabditis auriculariae]|uniref:alpha-1,6-mannosyl-glycoprotein 6-beta-N-acetylglucosaminyltransferase n=1 Tax=Caenorhabditis auriculariae TaxID=2777116 RepID=A0A8S1GZI4_9PELO|nr:unnamed protein product [Caenorhabditis auriculariae]
MKSRITKFWPNWVRGINEATAKYPKTFQRRKRLNIIVLIGFLANESSIKFAQKSGQGGPLGELLQWSDLIAALSILGHNLHIASDRNTLKSIVNDYSDNQPCPFADGQSSQIDLIFTDIMGLRLFRRHKSFITANKCRVRLLDSFGTHAEFSNKNYFLTHRDELSGLYSRKNPWGGHGLRLQQHWTFYPHSHDNTFLGFVVDDAASRGESAENQKTLFSRDSKDAALVYGKEQYMWKGVERPIEILKEMTEVHATVADALNVTSLDLFKNVVNHGFLHADQISALLKSVKIFFGMGFPLEGPAPLEAIANGAVFINAAFREPKTRRNNKFLSEKPTLREWTSQCPYMEEFGPPHVYTIDINNEEVLRETIRKALTNKPSPIVPEEFSTRGMLLRVSRLVQKQDFCGQMDEIAWPPVDALKIVLSSPEKLESCESACWRHRFVCEPTFFPLVNRHEQILEHNSSCRELVRRVASPLAPFNCELQASPQLFSCASRPSSAETAVTRLCPCRDFLSQQQALCSDCL